jgi:hypothetical protein
LLKALIDGGAGIETLAIERPGLHEAFVAIAGDAAARAMEGGACRVRELVRSAFVIARRDFTATVLSRTFLLFLLGPFFPLLIVVIFGAATAPMSVSEQPTVAVISTPESSASSVRPGTGCRTRSARSRWSISNMSRPPANLSRERATCCRANPA